MYRQLYNDARLVAASVSVVLSTGSAALAAPGDDYLCYRTAPGTSFTTVQKSLQDQSGTIDVDVRSFVAVCNPAQTGAGPGPTYPQVDEVGYGIRSGPGAPTFTPSTHVAVDPFGSHPVVLVRPETLLAPSANAPGSGGVGLVDTAGVDHFACYRATLPRGTPRFAAIPGVSVTDQFGGARYDLLKLLHFCTPVNKNGEDPTAPAHPGRLVCYQARRSKGQAGLGPHVVSVDNTNFGPAVLIVRAPTELCVSAFEESATTTSTTTTSSSTSPTATSSTTSSTSTVVADTSTTSTTESSTTVGDTTTTSHTTTSSTTTTVVCGTFLTMWGGSGSGNGQFKSPNGIAVDHDGNVFVVDTGHDRIQKFTDTGTFVGKWGSGGTGDGQFLAPRDVAVDPTGNVYVVEQSNNRVQKFSNAGTFIAKWGSLGTAQSQFQEPLGIAVDESANVYVADQLNNRIQKFTSSGDFLASWGSAGTGDGQFTSPAFVAVRSGIVYVPGSADVQTFMDTGTFLSRWGSAGKGDGRLNDPDGIAVDPNGNAFVADDGNSRIQEFTSGGAFLAKWGSAGTGAGQFNRPQHVAVDTHGNVFVADESNDRIQKFACP